MNMLWILAFGVLLLAFMYVRWRMVVCSVGLPGPPPTFIVGNVPEMARNENRKNLMFLEWFEQYQTTYLQFFIFGQRIILHKDPKFTERCLMAKDAEMPKWQSAYDIVKPLMGNGLLTSAGATFKKHKAILVKLFSTSMLRKNLSSIDRDIEKLHSTLDRACETGQPVEMDSLFTAASMDMIGTIAFGQSIGTQEDPDHPMLTAIGRAVKSCQFLLAFQFLVPFYRWVMPQLCKDVDYVRGYALRCLQTRRAQLSSEESAPDDLLTALASEPDFTDEEIVDEIVTFLFAGHDTTSHAMAFTLQQLLLHPECNSKAVAEADQVLARAQLADFNHVGKLVYLEQCFKESNRLHPTAGPGPRCLLQDEIITATVKGQTKEVVAPKGTMVWAGMKAMHLDPATWGDNAANFHPERFSAERAEDLKRNRGAYIPFSLGVRSCIGQNLAFVEAKAVLGSVLQRYHMVLCANPSCPEKGVFDPREDHLDQGEFIAITCKPSNGVWVTLSRR